MSQGTASRARTRWRGRFAFAAVGVGATIGLAACSPSLDWRVVAVAEPVSALFPCRVERRARDGVALAGQVLSITQWACREQGMTFAVSHARLPAGQSPDPVLVAWSQAAGRNLGAAVEPAAPRGLRQAAAGPATAPTTLMAQQSVVRGQAPDGTALRHDMLLFAAGTGVYQASVLGNAPDAGAVDAFFEGIEVKR